MSSQIKPISYLKAHASEVMRQLCDQQSTLIITYNGEAKAVMQDIHSYEKGQETMALLKILAMGNAQIQDANTAPAINAFKSVRESRKNR